MSHSHAQQGAGYEQLPQSAQDLISATSDQDNASD